MGKNKKIDENITRRGYNWLENYLMQMIEASYEELKKGETTLLDICKGAVDTARHNHVHYNTREDRMQIYQMAKECLTRVEDYMASQEGMTDDNMFPPHTDGDNPYESKNMKNTVRITESQLKQMITESVKRVINEIGDTNAGLAAIKRAQTKALDLGRKGQYEKFKDYGDKLDDGTILSNSSISIIYINLNGEKICINRKGEVLKDGSYIGTIHHILPALRTPYFRVARVIANWVKDNVQDASERATDWHKYASK